ncbi:hypothetical protein BOC42_00230 [Burkholderia pseudomallei]|nr:hypothetical protein BOC42_00230 [Burkholderia pseudomallei]
MATINVQFLDSNKTVIVSYFANPQNAQAFPNQGQIPSSDARYATFFNSLPSFAQQGMPAPV